MSGLQVHAYVLATKIEMVIKFTVCALFCFELKSCAALNKTKLNFASL